MSQAITATESSHSHSDGNVKVVLEDSLHTTMSGTEGHIGGPLSMIKKKKRKK